MTPTHLAHCELHRSPVNATNQVLEAKYHIERQVDDVDHEHDNGGMLC